MEILNYNYALLVLSRMVGLEKGRYKDEIVARLGYGVGVASDHLHIDT